MPPTAAVVATIAITDASQVSFSGSTLTINPTSDLAPGTHYYVTLASGVVQDLAGNAYAGLSASTDFDFTTASQISVAKVSYDFDGDGHSDILWQNDSGQAAVWLMNGTTSSRPAMSARPTPPGTSRAQAISTATARPTSSYRMTAVRLRSG